MNKTVCFISRGSIRGSVRTTLQLNKALYEHFNEVFDDLVFLDVSKVFTTAMRFGGAVDEEAYKLLPSKYQVVTPKGLYELKEFFRSRKMITICDISEHWYDLYLYYYLRKFSIPHVLMQTVSFVGDFGQSSRAGKRKLPRWMRKIKKRMSLSWILRSFIRQNFWSEDDILFMSNRRHAERHRDFGSSRREVCVTNSLYYDRFLSNKYAVSDEFIVFLDSMLPYHGDQRQFGYAPIDRKLYTENLNRVFDALEAALNKRVIICLHPKYPEDYIRRDFGDREAVKYRTDEFVSKAGLVLFHESSAVNSAVLHKKPVIQLTGSGLNAFIRENCTSYRKIFSFPVLDMYEATDSEIREAAINPKIDLNRFNDFLSKFIIASGEEGVPSSVQIARRIKEKYGV